MASNKAYQVGFVFGAKKASGFDGTLKGVVKGLAGIATAYVGISAIKGAVDTFATFEQSMANVKAISGATKEEFEQLEAAAMEMGRKTSKTAAESADALGYMALAGWDAQQSIAGLEPILRLSEAGSMDLATASDLVTDSMSAMDIAVSELGGYLDYVAQAQSSANTNAQQLMEAYLDVGGKLKDMNVELDESATLLGVMANRGIKGAEAGKSLSSIMANLLTPTGQAKKALDELGISAFDGQGNFKGLEATFLELNQALGGLTEQQQRNYKDMIAGKSQSAGLGAILDGLNKEYVELKGTIQDCDGALMNQAEIMNNTLEGAFKRLSSATDDLKIRMVKSFSGSMIRSVDALATFIPKATGRIESGITWLKDRALPVFDSIKGKGIAAFVWIRSVGQASMKAIQDKFVVIRPHLESFQRMLIDIGGTIKDRIQTGFELAKPAISWVAETGFPAMIGVAALVLGKVSDVYFFFRNNWNSIAPIVYGIVGAFAAYKAIMFGITAVEKAKNAVMLISKGVMIASTAAQWALNVAMTANPIGIVVAAIGILIGIGVALYKNWDVIKEKAGVLWEGMKGIFGGIGDWFAGIWDGVKSGFKAFINFIIDGLNLIPKGLNSLSVALPDWIPGVGGKTLGFSIPLIPKLAKGGLVTGPTLAMVGEGSESEAVLPLSKLFALLDSVSGGGGGGVVFSPQIIIQGNASKQDVEDALGLAQKQFETMYERMMNNKKRRQLNPT